MIDITEKSRFARGPGWMTAGVLALLVIGCTTTPPSDVVATARGVGSETIAPVRLNEGNLVDFPSQSRPAIDVESEPLYRILVAEFAGQRGRLDVAVEQYLASAKELQELEIAKRATRISVFARNDIAALEAAEIWVKLAPKDIEARQILAAMQIRSGNAEAAVKHLEYVLNKATEDDEKQLTMIANLLSREQDKRTALTVMEQLLSRRIGHPQTHAAYALMAIRAEDHDKAARAMGRMVEAGALDTNIAVAYVAMLQKNERTLAALNWLDDALKRNPADHDLRLVYARLLADANNYDRARAQFAMLAAATPDNADVLFALGLLNLQGNEIAAAEKNFQQLLVLESRRDDANFYLAQIAESREQTQSALAYYRAINSGANYFQAQIRIALIFASLGQIDNAQAQLHAVIPQDEAQRLQLVRAEGEVLTQNEKYEEAISLYDSALADTYDMELLYSRAMLAEKLDRLDVLEADLRTIIEHEPENSQALNALGYTLADHTDRYEEAYGFIERALALSPDDFYILDSMGWVLYRLGRLPESVEYLRRARELKDDPEVAAHLGEVLWVMGDREAAQKIWNSALQGKPADQRLLDVIERLVP